MRAPLFALLALAAAVSATQLAQFEKRAPFNAIYSSLVARAEVIDPDIIPSECKSACADTVNDLNSCADDNCLCTNSNGKQLKRCVDCLVKLGGPTVASSGQSTLDTFVDGCDAAGKNVDPLTVGGSDSNSNSNTGSALNLVANGGVLTVALAGVVAYLI